MTETPEEILAKMRKLSNWIRGRLFEFDDILKMKNDLGYYQHQTAQLMIRVDTLERKIASLKIDSHDTE